MAIDFPISELMDQDACYDWLVSVLHPQGLACPRCGGREDTSGLRVHHRNRAPVLDYQCRSCKRVFNAFAETMFAGTPKRPSELVLILRGFARGETTAGMAREMGFSRGHLLELRHQCQANVFRAMARQDAGPMTQDHAVEADEMYQSAGEKRCPAHRPGRPAAAAGQ